MIRPFTVFQIVFFVQIMFFSLSAIIADSPVQDPGIPAGEKITYKVTEGDEEYTLIQHTHHIKKDGRELYEIKTESKTEDTIIRIEREKMNVVYSKSTRKGPEYVVESEINIIKNEIQSGEGEIVLASFAGINHILRGFTFEKGKTCIIRSPESGDMTMVVKVKKETSVPTPAGDIPCYLLEFGMTGFWGAFLPKTLFWYSIKPPHYCVKFEGQAGPPGSPATIILLVGYESNEQDI